MNEPIRIFTDGSAIGNPGPGGWAAIIIQGKSKRTIYGGNNHTCIAEMELTAACQALMLLSSGAAITLHSDSDMLIQGMKYLTKKWMSQGWRNRRGQPLKYQELWTQLLDLDRNLKIRWCWIRGHNGHPIQQRADSIAFSQAAARRNALLEVASANYLTRAA
jgi:ribonuclease HI